jgi:hypothetical protein
LIANHRPVNKNAVVSWNELPFNFVTLCVTVQMQIKIKLIWRLTIFR